MSFWQFGFADCQGSGHIDLKVGTMTVFGQRIEGPCLASLPGMRSSFRVDLLEGVIFVLAWVLDLRDD